MAHVGGEQAAERRHLALRDLLDHIERVVTVVEEGARLALGPG